MILLLKVLVFPKRVFDEIREQSPYKLPLWSILIVGFVCFLLAVIEFKFTYYIAQAVFVSLVMALWNSIVSLVVLMSWASYYWIASKSFKIDIGWHNWFCFTCWTVVPSILGSIANALILQFAVTDPIEVLNPYPWFGWFGMTFLSIFWLPIPLVWSLYIAVNGFMSWTSKGLGFSIVVVVTPAAVLTLLQAFPSVPIISDFVRLTSF
ncbi:MAG: YIP1 family protein [Gammaproteobacteria bacterium]|nr:YIP1 family protein [Gammaproteobacteria bacterium]